LFSSSRLVPVALESISLELTPLYSTIQTGTPPWTLRCVISHAPAVRLQHLTPFSSPTSTLQAQDRAHRIGQTRDVHIYRLVSEATIEENILLKARQKRQLADMTVEQGQFTTAALFSSVSVRDLVGDSDDLPVGRVENDSGDVSNPEFLRALAAAEDDDDRAASKAASAEAEKEIAEFDESAAAVSQLGTPAGSATVTAGAAVPGLDDNDSDGDRAESDGVAVAPVRGGAAGKRPRASSDSSHSSTAGGSADNRDASESSASDSSSESRSDGEHEDDASDSTGSGDDTRAPPLKAAASAKRVHFSIDRAADAGSRDAKANGGTNRPRKKPSTASAVGSASALDRIDLDALELETTAAEEGLEDELQQQKRLASAASAGSAKPHTVKPSGAKGASAAALFDAVTVGAGVAAPVHQQRDRVAIALAKFAVVAASLQVRVARSS
jgi:hypothetical protein